MTIHAPRAIRFSVGSRTPLDLGAKRAWKRDLTAERRTALAAVNGAIERIVSPLAAELAPVRVNAASPGVVDTPWWSFLTDEQRQAQFEASAGSVPAGRIGTAADVADAIGYLVHASLGKTTNAQKPGVLFSLASAAPD